MDLLSFFSEDVPFFLLLKQQESSLYFSLLYLLFDQLEILLVIFRQYGLFKTLLEVLKLLKLACKLHVLLDVVESVLDSPSRRLQILLRQLVLFDSFFAETLQMVVFFCEKHGLHQWLDETLTHASL